MEIKRMLKKEYFIIFLIFIIIVLTFSTYYLLDFKNNKNKNALSNNINPISQDQTQNQAKEQAQLQINSSDPVTTALIEKVFKHILLPSGDVRVETVNKPELLRKINPIFYQFAKEGDNILIFADRAILYDPKVDKVLDIFHATSSPFLIPTKQ